MTPARILAVDDNRDILMLLEAVLVRHGFQVCAVADGAGALEALEGGGFDVVLLDVMMPGMNGFEVLERIRQDVATASVPVIMLTAKTRDDELLHGYACGADYYIPKPFTAEQLLYGISLVTDRAPR